MRFGGRAAVPVKWDLAAILTAAQANMEIPQRGQFPWKFQSALYKHSNQTRLICETYGKLIFDWVITKSLFNSICSKNITIKSSTIQVGL